MNKTVMQRSGIRTVIALFGGMVVSYLLKQLAGVDAEWVGPVSAAITAAWNAWKNPSRVPEPVDEQEAGNVVIHRDPPA